jgi:hypothetical protein
MKDNMGVAGKSIPPARAGGITLPMRYFSTVMKREG